MGTTASAVDLGSVEGARPYEDGWAIPMKGAKPSWLTPDLQTRLATGEVVAAPAQAPLPSEIGIRPGAWMIAPAGCTMNFVFQKGGSYAIGTAGHCVDKIG